MDYKKLYEREKALREEEQRRREEEQRRREEAERQAREAQQETREAQQQLTQIWKQIDPTDFDSYLSLCHHELFLELAIQTDSSLASATGHTKIDGKYYPLHLEPWTSFSSQHEKCLGHLRSTFGHGKHFLPLSSLQVIRELLSEDPVADEADMRQFQFLAVEDCTKKVLRTYLALREKQAAPTQSGDDDDADDALQPPRPLPDHIKFLNNPYGVLSAEGPEGAPSPSDLPAYVPAMEAVRVDDAESRGRPPGDGPPPAKRISSPRPKLYPDQWCFRTDGESYVPIFVIEYKAAHKLPASSIKMALAHTQGTDLFRDVVQELHSSYASQDEQTKAVVAAKRATAQVLVQAFHYMVDFGLCYSYVTSGEALILLYMDAEDPQTLYFHLAVPREEVQTAEEGGADDLRWTAVALVSTMVLLALEAPQLTQRWKQNAQAMLKKWAERYAEFEGDDSEGSQGRRLPAHHHPRPSLPPPADAGGCREPIKGWRRRDDSDDRDDSDGDYKLPPRSQGTLPLSTTRTTRASTRRDQQSGNSGSSTTQTTRTLAGEPVQYCTQACLLSMRDGRPLDQLCPNLRRHLQDGVSENNNHAINQAKFLKLMQEQLEYDLDENCEALDKYGKFGAIGTLFRLTLQPFGYCVVAKGVQTQDLERLRGEECVYQHLQEQQGYLVPVCLGIIPLTHEYWTSSGAHISHMMLQSYCGEPIRKKDLQMLADMRQRIERLWTRLGRLGVEHGDERDLNVVWDAGLQRLMCVDFDCAKIKTETSQGVASLKRKRVS